MIECMIMKKIKAEYTTILQSVIRDEHVLMLFSRELIDFEKNSKSWT